MNNRFPSMFSIQERSFQIWAGISTNGCLIPTEEYEICHLGDEPGHFCITHEQTFRLSLVESRALAHSQ